MRLALGCSFLVEELLRGLEATATIRSPSEGGRRLVTSGVSELRVLGRVGRFGIGERLVDFFVDGVLRAVGRLRGVGGHLGSVERDQTDSRHPRLGAQAKRRGEDGPVASGPWCKCATGVGSFEPFENTKEDPLFFLMIRRPPR